MQINNGNHQTQLLRVHTLICYASIISLYACSKFISGTGVHIRILQLRSSRGTCTNCRSFEIITKKLVHENLENAGSIVRYYWKSIHILSKKCDSYRTSF